MAAAAIAIPIDTAWTADSCSGRRSPAVRSGKIPAAGASNASTRTTPPPQPEIAGARSRRATRSRSARRRRRGSASRRSAARSRADRAGVNLTGAIVFQRYRNGAVNASVSRAPTVTPAIVRPARARFNERRRDGERDRGENRDGSSAALKGPPHRVPAAPSGERAPRAPRVLLSRTIARRCRGPSQGRQEIENDWQTERDRAREERHSHRGRSTRREGTRDRARRGRQESTAAQTATRARTASRWPRRRPRRAADAPRRAARRWRRWRFVRTIGT